jgi:hypothetical protein
MLRRSVGPLNLDSERGFILRFAALAVALVVLPWLVSLGDPGGPLRYLIPGTAAAILVLTYLWRPAEALLALALFILFYDTLAIQVGSSLTRVDELAVPLIALIALVRVWRRWREWIWPLREIALVVGFALGVLSSVAAHVPLSTWVPAMFLVAKPIAFFYTVLWTRFSTEEIRAAMRVALAVALAVMVLGLVELLNPVAFQQFFGLPFFSQGRSALPIVKSILIHPALFGWFTTFVALFVYAQYVVDRRLRWLFVGLFLSLGPMLSARRRAILALAGSLLVGFGESIRRIRSARELARTWVPVAIGSLALFLVFLPGLSSLYTLTLVRYLGVEVTPSLAPGETPPPLADEENPRARFALYSGSVHSAVDYFPLGAGFGRYGSWMSRVDYSPLYDRYGMSDIRGLRRDKPQYITDTFWPQILGEMGVGGLVAYIVLIGSMGLLLWREAARDDGPLLAVLRFGAGMIFAQTIIESFASSMFHSPPRVYLVFLAIGAVASIAWRRRAAEVAGQDTG